MSNNLFPSITKSGGGLLQSIVNQATGQPEPIDQSLDDTTYRMKTAEEPEHVISAGFGTHFVAQIGDVAEGIKETRSSSGRRSRAKVLPTINVSELKMKGKVSRRIATLLTMLPNPTKARADEASVLDEVIGHVTQLRRDYAVSTASFYCRPLAFIPGQSLLADMDAYTGLPPLFQPFPQPRAL